MANSYKSPAGQEIIETYSYGNLGQSVAPQREQSPAQQNIEDESSYLKDQETPIEGSASERREGGQSNPDGLAQERSRDARTLINKINPKSLSITSRIYTFFSKFFNIVMY